MSEFSKISKHVGWEPRSIDYPQIEAVWRATKTRDLYMLLAWNRFLPSPTDETEAEIINSVVAGLIEVRRVIE